MLKRRLKKVKKVRKATSLEGQVAKALEKETKAELVKLIMEFARNNRGLMRTLESRLEVKALDQDLITSTRQAIADATDFDERETNRNFDYDYEAYGVVKRNFVQLIKTGHLSETMELALELMKAGSYQVEMSDEGMMSDDLEGCLQVVILALRTSVIPAAEVIAWCEAMTKNDRVGFLCDTELRALRARCEAAG